MTATADIVATVEAIPLGEPYGEALDAARVAVAADRERCELEIFPRDLPPVTHDTIEQYRWLTSRLPERDYGAKLAALHARALGVNPALCALLRSVEAHEDVYAAASSLAVPESPQEPHAEAGARAGAAAVARYRLEIARQLAAAPGHDAGAAAGLLAAEQLAGRLDAARVKQEEHARAAAAQLELERLAAERAAEEAELRALVDRELVMELRRRGLPENLEKCRLVDDERHRLEQLVHARARLSRTRANAVRVAGCLYDARDLGRSLGAETSPSTLAAITEGLDRAERAIREGFLP